MAHIGAGDWLWLLYILFSDDPGHVKVEDLRGDLKLKRPVGGGTPSNASDGNAYTSWYKLAI